MAGWLLASVFNLRCIWSLETDREFNYDQGGTGYKLTEGQQQQDDGGGDEVHRDVVPREVQPRRLLHLVKPLLVLEEVPKPV